VIKVFSIQQSECSPSDIHYADWFKFICQRK